MQSFLIGAAVVLTLLALELHNRYTALLAVKEWCRERNIALVRTERVVIGRPARVEFAGISEGVECFYVVRLSSWGFGSKWTVKLESQFPNPEIT